MLSFKIKMPDLVFINTYFWPEIIFYGMQTDSDWAKYFDSNEDRFNYIRKYSYCKIQHYL